MSEYIYFEEIDNPGRKTQMWKVMSTSQQAQLGIVRWWGPWRQYTFIPDPFSIWNVDCLREVVRFISAEMDKRKVAA